MRLPFEGAQTQVQGRRPINRAIEGVPLHLLEADAALYRLLGECVLDRLGEGEILVVEGNRSQCHHGIVHGGLKGQVGQQVRGGGVEDDLHLRLRHHRRAAGHLLDPVSKGQGCGISGADEIKHLGLGLDHVGGARPVSVME